MFNKYFSTLIGRMKLDYMDTGHAMSFLRGFFPNSFPKMEIIPITEAELLGTISELTSQHSSGYEDLSNKIIKLQSPHISKPLTNIFYKSLSQGIFLE
jgi:hypothetical protein